ncbi:TetR/AcrR family transcriptional regulator [soil metagenome]
MALEQARAAFWNTGYAATSLDDLSAATGLNRPSLYGAFGDKKAMYIKALEISRAEINTGLAAAMAPEEHLRVALTRVYEASAGIYMRGDCGPRGCFLIGTAVTEAVDDPDIRGVLATALTEIDAAFEARISRAMEVGNLPGSSDAAGMARVATGVLNGMAVRARAGGDLATLRAMGASVVDLICGRAGR